VSERQPTIAVIGAGLAGTLVTVQLLRYAARPLRIVLIERSGDFGPGIAYKTRDPQHRLNVPAARMSAFPEAPLHLLTWASKRLGRRVDGAEFLPRGLYGDYLRALLMEEQARLASPGSVELIATEAERVVRVGEGALVELGEGGPLPADAAVLAIGNPPPAAPAGLPEDPRIVADPWAPGALEKGAAGTTVVVGTSLTALDVALTVARQSPRGQTLAISRSGLVPYANLPGLRDPAPPPEAPTGKVGLDELERSLRGHARHMVSEGYDWRDVVDGIRPRVPALWQALSVEDRRRFLKELLREWSVRRHRIAPEANRELESVREAGRLELAAAPIRSAVAREDCVELRLDGERGERLVRAGRVICCAGAEADIRRVGGVVGRALEDGIATADPLALGLRAGDCGALIDRTGSALGPIYTLGPPLRGELWETTAAREISVQAEKVALDLCRGLDLLPLATAGASRRP
jgi:uncharacterized NAD(P)/FAD-binding protein YdhS